MRIPGGGGATLPKRIVVFDTETTGVDVEQDRIVTAFIGVMDVGTGQMVQSWSWLIDPEIEIPKGASDVHGISTEYAREHGKVAKDAIYEIIQRLDILQRENLIVVVMNAVFDFTILDRETLRHWPTLRPYEPKLVFDPMVLDRALDKYRAGKRTLVDLAQVYGVPVEANAHDAEADCRMAGRVAIRLLGHSRLTSLTPQEVHAKLIPTYRNNSLGLAAYWEDDVLPRLRGAERDAKIASIKHVRAHADHWPMWPRP